MMPLNRREYVHVFLLLLCVPAQYLLNKYFGYLDEGQRGTALKRIFLELSEIKRFFFHWHFWQNWGTTLHSLAKKKTPISSLFDYDIDESLNECPAIEVLNYRGAHTGYFSDSPVIRSPHPEYVKYRIGQVVIHKEQGFRGVIVGWDLVAKAPETWLKLMHPSSKQHWRMLPNYAVLVDERDRKDHQRVYIPQESIIILESIQIMHNALDDYFDGYDGTQYLPRPSLRILYPHD